MNPHSGHLTTDVSCFIQTDYVPVPPHLDRAARRKLAGRTDAHVSLTSGGKLSKFAADQRRKARNKRKIAKASRQRNR